MVRSFFSWLKGSKTSRRGTPNPQTSRGFRPTVEALEVREMPLVAAEGMIAGTWLVRTDNASTEVRLTSSPFLGWQDYTVTEVGSGRTWTRSSLEVARLEFRGGAGNDRFVNLTQSCPVTADGWGGSDYLEGGPLADLLLGGDGDDTLVGNGGGDRILGLNGNDFLYGGGGDDRLNGGNGSDHYWGDGGNYYTGDGNDVVIAIDNATGDSVYPDSGCDIIWVDKASAAIGAATDVVGLTDAGVKVQYVVSFKNGADKTLDFDRIAANVERGKRPGKPPARLRAIRQQTAVLFGRPTADGHRPREPGRLLAAGGRGCHRE